MQNHDNRDKITDKREVMTIKTRVMNYTARGARGKVRRGGKVSRGHHHHNNH